MSMWTSLTPAAFQLGMGLYRTNTVALDFGLALRGRLRIIYFKSENISNQAMSRHGQVENVSTGMKISSERP